MEQMKYETLVEKVNTELPKYQLFEGLYGINKAVAYGDGTKRLPGGNAVLYKLDH